MILPVYVGFDQREAAAYHVFCQSVIHYASRPVSFLPLSRRMLDGFDGQRDGTNAFIFSRFLVPMLQGFDGWAIFVDGDMIVRDDIAKLYACLDYTKAVMVAPHAYRTKHKRKYVGSPLENDNVDYPCKNWSSVVLWNCSHPSNRILSRRFVEDAPGEFLHRFAWLKPEEIGTLPLEWNWLVGEYHDNPEAKLLHHTLGTPGMHHYAETDQGWHRHLLEALQVSGEDPVNVVKRARDRS